MSKFFDFEGSIFEQKNAIFAKNFKIGEIQGFLKEK